MHTPHDEQARAEIASKYCQLATAAARLAGRKTALDQLFLRDDSWTAALEAVTLAARDVDERFTELLGDPRVPYQDELRTVQPLLPWLGVKSLEKWVAIMGDLGTGIARGLIDLEKR